MDKDKRIAESEKENKALKNRCYALSDGTMCFFCPLECEHRSSDFRNSTGDDE